MELLLIIMAMLNSVLLTLVVVGARVARKEADKVLSEAKSHADKAAAFVNTAHSSVSGMAEQVVTLTKRFDDLKSTTELLKLRITK